MNFKSLIPFLLAWGPLLSLKKLTFLSLWMLSTKCDKCWVFRTTNWNENGWMLDERKWGTWKM